MANFSQLTVNDWCRLRGLALEMLLIRHRQQGSHMDSVMLCAVVNQAGFSVGERDVITAVQELVDRGYATCRQRKSRWTNQVEIDQIGITPKGRDLVDGISEADPALLVR
jgi:hypothetical protein